MRSNVACSAVTNPVNVDEVDAAIKNPKPGKAAGTDGILPEFLHNLGSLAKLLLAKVFTMIIDTVFFSTLETHQRNSDTETRKKWE